MIAPDETASRVFVIHGRNESARVAMFTLLRSVGLRPIEWSQAVASTGQASPYIGEVLDSAFRSAQAVVVLMTPDEMACLRPEFSSIEDDPETKPAGQARLNVLFEAGMALARDPHRTVIVELGAVRPFSDIAGRHTIRMTNGPEHRKDLLERLKNAGCAVDMSGTDWLRQGDFTEPAEPSSSLSLVQHNLTVEDNDKNRVDLWYERRAPSGVLHVTNVSSETILAVSIHVPSDVKNFMIFDEQLPIHELPAGKSVQLHASRVLVPGENYFRLRVSYETFDDNEVHEEPFLSLGI